LCDIHWFRYQKKAAKEEQDNRLALQSRRDYAIDSSVKYFITEEEKRIRQEIDALQHQLLVAKFKANSIGDKLKAFAMAHNVDVLVKTRFLT